MGTNLQGYHLLWPDLPTFSQLQFTAPFTNRISSKGACWFFHHPIHNKSNETWRKKKEVNTLLRNEASCLFFFKPPIRSRSPLLTGSRLISLPLATQMFQFAKF